MSYVFISTLEALFLFIGIRGTFHKDDEIYPYMEGIGYPGSLFSVNLSEYSTIPFFIVCHPQLHKEMHFGGYRCELFAVYFGSKVQQEEGCFLFIAGCCLCG